MEINKRSALIASTLSSFLTPFMGSSINIAIPSIGREFNMDAILLSWVATSFLLSAAMFLVPFGRIADIRGRKKIFKYGILIYTLSSFLSAISSSSVQLICFRVLQGAGSAMIFGTAVAILTSVFPDKERGKVLGINASAVYLGLSLGPFLGGILTQHFGWRSIFLTNAFLGLITTFFVFFRLSGEWAEARGEKFDLAGSLIYSISLTALMYGFSQLSTLSGIWLTLAGCIGILIFILWEIRTDSPVLNVKIFKDNRAFTFSNLSALINYSATFAVSFLMSLYLQYIRGLSPQNAGLILVSQPVVMAVFSPFAGRLSDRIEPRKVASFGMALTTIGLFLLTFLDEKTKIEFIIGGLLILGFGFAFFSSPNTNAVMSSVERKFYGIASGMLGTMRLVGQALSMGLAMLIISLHLGKVQIRPEYHAIFLNNIKIAFWIFSFLCFCGIFASLARGDVHLN